MNRGVLLVGASGQLGRALARAFADRHLVTASYQHVGATDAPVDLGDPAALKRLVDRIQPELILIAGAMCNVDRCEQEQAACMRVNVDGPSMLADWSRSSGARVVLFSTDHVFDGTKQSYQESDPVNPLNTYSRSKALAEEELRSRLPDRHLIIRTAWVYGPDEQRRNFVLRLIDRVSAGETVAVPIDQWGSPTYTEDLAGVTRHLVDRGERGTFHATGPRLVDRMTLAQMICNDFTLPARSLAPTSTRDLAQPAKRPARVLLNCEKLYQTGVAPLRDVAEGLKQLHAWNDGARVGR